MASPISAAACQHREPDETGYRMRSTQGRDDRPESEDAALRLDPRMTAGIMSRRGLLRRSVGADMSRETVGFAAERLMEMEVSAMTGAAFGESLAQRDGYWNRQTRVGMVGLAPRPRSRDRAVTDG